MTRRSFRYAGPVLLITLAGCANRVADLSGKVTTPGGAPLAGGRITFRSASDPKRATTADILADGTYQALGVPAETCQVAVETSFLKGKAPAPQLSLKAGDPMGTVMKPSDVKYLKHTPIDPKYESADTSGLTVSVSGPTQVADFEVAVSTKP